MQRICICALLVSVSLLIVAAEVRDSANQLSYMHLCAASFCLAVDRGC